nr:MAG TPA: hypothetical protein [Microviridae sp.]
MLDRYLILTHLRYGNKKRRRSLFQRKKAHCRDYHTRSVLGSQGTMRTYV